MGSEPEELNSCGYQELGVRLIAELEEGGGEEVIAINDDGMEVGEVGLGKVRLSKDAKSDGMIEL